MEVSSLESRAWRIAHSGLDLDTAFTAFDELLRPHVQYAIASWSTHDPATGLFTSCTMSGAEGSGWRGVAVPLRVRRG